MKIIAHFIVIILLTIFTQVGGLIWLACIPIFRKINQKFPARLQRRLIKTASFLFIYTLLSWTLIPAFAKMGGRVALPASYSEDFPIQASNRLFCWMNRHYVTPKTKATLKDIALKTQQQYPGTKLLYLDANFPFIKGFPLPPHLSHNDGRKLDIAFLYQDLKTGKAVNGQRTSFIGYGICEEAQKGEYDQAAACTKQGHTLYSLLQKISPQGKRTMKLDEKRSARLLRNITGHQSVSRVFIEPHLKKRMGLSGEAKIRFHGCHAVRHDDHIHIEVR